MEKFDHQPKVERDLVKNKLSFVEAVEAGGIVEIETEFDEAAQRSLATKLEDTMIFVLGEMHGVKENADIIYTLFKKFGFRNLALEWEPSLHKKVEEFLATGIVDFDSIKHSPDGRITAGHFALLKKLKDEGLLDTFICFDQGSGLDDWDERDANMAKNILASLSSTPTLVVSGNLHTEMKPITFQEEEGVEEEHHPMGEIIKGQIPSVPSGRIKYLAGEFHNYGTKEFEKKSADANQSAAKFYRSEDGLYIFELPRAHPAVVPNPSEI